MQDAVGVSAALVARFAEHADERRREHEALHLPGEREQLVHAVQHEATYLGAARRTLTTRSRVAELIVIQPRLQLDTPLHQNRDERSPPPAGQLLGQQRGEILRRGSDYGGLRIRCGLFKLRVNVWLGRDTAHELSALGAVDTSGVAAQCPSVLLVGAADELRADLGENLRVLAAPDSASTNSEVQPAETCKRYNPPDDHHACPPISRR